MRTSRNWVPTGIDTARAGTLLEKMRSKGLRLTGQRRLVAQLLDRADNHLDAQAVLDLARRQDPTIHRATVYRILHRLKRLGLIDELDLMHVSGERHFYEVRPSSLHIHLVCTRCRTVEEPSGPFWDDLKNRVHQTSGFTPEVIRIEMAGLCPELRPPRIRKEELVDHLSSPLLCRLSELPLWTEGTVESVQGHEDLRRRLLEMGFCNRARVTAIRRAPLGDPVEYFLRGYYVSLRSEEARHVLVGAAPERRE